MGKRLGVVMGTASALLMLGCTGGSTPAASTGAGATSTTRGAIGATGSTGTTASTAASSTGGATTAATTRGSSIGATASASSTVGSTGSSSASASSSGTSATSGSSSGTTTAGSSSGTSTASASSTGSSGASSASSTSGSTGSTGTAQACAALVPASIGSPISVQLGDNFFDCTGAYGDDEGNGLLVETFTNGPPSTIGKFFRYASGAVTQQSNTIGHGDESGFSLQGQPDGFVSLFTGASGSSTLYSYDASGTQTGSAALSAQGYFNVAVASSISGFVYAAVSTGNSTPAPATVQRYDVHLQPLGAPITYPNGTTLSAVGVSRSGHVLVISAAQGGAQQAQWFTFDLQPLTAPFTVQVSVGSRGNSWRQLIMLADGSLAARNATSYTAVFPDAQPTMLTPPAWLAARGGSDLFPIRGFTGYAATPPGPGCSGTVEILTADGTSCGCIDTQDVSPGVATLGRDGTLFVPTHTTSGTCSYSWYPQLLR